MVVRWDNVKKVKFTSNNIILKWIINHFGFIDNPVNSGHRWINLSITYRNINKCEMIKNSIPNYILWCKCKRFLNAFYWYYAPSTLIMSIFLIQPLLLNHLATQLSSRGWVDLVPDIIDILNCGSAGNRNLHLSQARWPLENEVIINNIKMPNCFYYIKD